LKGFFVRELSVYPVSQVSDMSLFLFALMEKVRVEMMDGAVDQFHRDKSAVFCKHLLTTFRIERILGSVPNIKSGNGL
jgi:hypothetical protein